MRQGLRFQCKPLDEVDVRDDEGVGQVTDLERLQSTKDRVCVAEPPLVQKLEELNKV